MQYGQNMIRTNPTSQIYCPVLHTLVATLREAENSTLLLSRAGLGSVHDNIDLKQTRATHAQTHKRTRQKHSHTYSASGKEVQNTQTNYNPRIRNIFHEAVSDPKMSEFGPILAKPNRTKRVKAKATYGHGRVNISALPRILLKQNTRLLKRSRIRRKRWGKKATERLNKLSIIRAFSLAV